MYETAMIIPEPRPWQAALRVLGASAVTLAILLGVRSVSAAPLCGQRQSLAETLAAVRGERSVSLGLDRTGQVVELLASENGRTWTLLVTRPDGASCVIARGRYWEVRTPPDPGEGT